MGNVGECAMNEIIRDQVCERADDLIGFLYGELTEWEARKFERHLRDCVGCKTEYAAFAELRESIVAWRNEALGLVGERVLPPAVLPIQPRQPSALAAIREFFNLSPLWLKGAAAFASVLFCVCAVLAIAYLKGQRPNPTIAQVNENRVYTPQELQANVAQEVEKRISDLQKTKQTAGVSVSGVAPKKVNRPAISPNSGYAIVRNRRRPLTQQERRELAADLRLLSSNEDELDLIGDSNRQSP